MKVEGSNPVPGTIVEKLTPMMTFLVVVAGLVVLVAGIGTSYKLGQDRAEGGRHDSVRARLAKLETRRMLARTRTRDENE